MADREYLMLWGAKWVCKKLREIEKISTENGEHMFRSANVKEYYFESEL